MKISKQYLQLFQNITRFLWAAFLFTFLFPKRFLLSTIDNNLHGGIVSTFQSYFYFPEFLLIFAFLGAVIFFQKPKFTRPPVLLWGVLFVLIIFTLLNFFFAPVPNQNFIYLIHFLEIFAISYIFCTEIIPTEKSIAVLLFSFGFQGLIGLTQLMTQGSLGLGVLGENTFDSSTLGIAKIDIADQKYIRPMGTTLHANAYGAVMLSGLILLFIWAKTYINSERKNLLNAARKKKSRQSKILIWSVILGSIFLLGAILSFSRAVWGATFLLLIWGMYYLKFYKKIYLIIFAFSFGIFSIFYEFFLSRIWSFGQAFSTRSEMYGYSLEAFKDSPFGLGIGRFGEYLTQHGHRIFAPWEIIPVHNIFFLIGNELGIIAGALIIVFAIGYVFYSANKNIFTIISLLGIGIIACTDHFFWTNTPMLFLLAILLILLEKSPKKL